MATYIAHYRSPNSGAERAKGTFEYESASRAGSKQNARDARLAMLTEFGNVAVSWIITEVELKGATAGTAEVADGQLELDFRDPIKEPKRKKRTVQRGLV